MNKIQPPIVKLFFGLLLLLLFVACDDRSHLDNSSTTSISLDEIQTLIIDKTITVGTVIGKIQLPINEDNNKIKNIFLSGEGSQNFSISKDGTITIKKILQQSKQMFFNHKQEMIIYNLKVEIFYFSGKIYYINLKIKDFSSTNEENNISLPTPTSTPTPIPTPTPTPTPTPIPTPTPTPTTPPIFNEFNVGIGGSPSFGFLSNNPDNEKIWLSINDLLLDDNISMDGYYKNIKNFKPKEFTRLHNYVKGSKFMTFWFVDGWEESWYDLDSIQEAMDSGHIPVFSYWYFGDRLVEGMPNVQKIERYKEDNLRVANLLKKLHGTKMLLMEPEFNKPAVIKDENSQHEFASIISNAIDIIKEENPNEVLFSLSMMDIGNRGVNATLESCGYENCSLGDKYAWSRSDIVFSDLVDKLDFISFHQMMAQFSRDYDNPGGWDSPNLRVYADEEIGVDFLADRVANMSQYLHEKYNKPIFMPYVTIATATWEDINEDNNVTDNEINYFGWEDKANNFYKRMDELRPTLKANGMFGFSPMALFDNPRQDYGGYQYFMQNEYHLGVIATNSIDELDKAPDGDLYFKGNILDYIYGYIPAPAPILIDLPCSTPLNSVATIVSGRAGLKVLVNGVEVGQIGIDGTLDITLDTSGESEVKTFQIVLLNSDLNESNPLIFEIEKISFKANFINEGNCSQIIDNSFIVVCYDYQFKAAKSVAYHLDGDLVNELNIEERPSFYEEESLDKAYRATSDDYSNSGYDRGHLAPDASFDWSQESLEAVYTLANIIPQAPTVNRYMWIDSEKYARTKAVEFGEIDVVNVVKYLPDANRIGEDNLTVSKGFYKILYSQDNNYTECFYYENNLDVNATDDNLSIHHRDCAEIK